MEITLTMLLTRLQTMHPELHLPNINDSGRPVRGILLLPESARFLRPDYLYLTDRKPDLPQEKIPDNTPLLVIAKEALSCPQTDFCCLETDYTMAECFCLLQQVWEEFTEWERQLDFAVYRNADFQEFIDLSEGILHFPSLFYDPTLRLLAHSRNLNEFPDPLFQSAIRDGYLNSDAVEHFIADHTFETINKKGSVTNQQTDYRHHADYIRAINAGNELAVYCVQIFSTAENESVDYQNQIFQILCNSIQNLLERQHSDFLRNRSVSDYFLQNLLDHPDTSPEDIREQIIYNDLDYEGNYILLLVCAELKQRMTSNYFLQMMRNNMISCRVFPYQNNFVVLYSIPKYQLPHYRNYLQKQLHFFNKEYSASRISIFISRPFTEISSFAPAYRQAANLKTLLSHSQPSSAKPELYFFADHATEDLFLMNSSPNPIFSYCEPALLQMLADGSRKSRQRLQILYTYLNCDRKLTETAKIFGMHRNNILYHIRNIEEEFFLDLDDPGLRLRLLNSFALLIAEKKITPPIETASS
jgi:sugar diacid utilization regulator